MKRESGLRHLSDVDSAYSSTIALNKSKLTDKSPPVQIMVEVMGHKEYASWCIKENAQGVETPKAQPGATHAVCIGNLPSRGRRNYDSNSLSGRIGQHIVCIFRGQQPTLREIVKAVVAGWLNVANDHKKVPRVLVPMVKSTMHHVNEYKRIEIDA